MKLTKISAEGLDLTDDATQWVAVRMEHELLARPLIFSVAEKKAKNWKAAKKHAEGLDLCGWQWRLPTVEELFLLADRTKFNPAIDKDFFPDCESDWYWTDTVAASPSGYAWGVYFSHGSSSWYDQDDVGWVRAVRAGQS